MPPLGYPASHALTNIVCDKCKTSIAYETISFQAFKCVLGRQHEHEYSIKCPTCKKGYGPWIKFDINLFPGYPDPTKCRCSKLRW